MGESGKYNVAFIKRKGEPGSAVSDVTAIACLEAFGVEETAFDISTSRPSGTAAACLRFFEEECSLL